MEEEKTLKFKGYMAEKGIRQAEIAELLGIDVSNANEKINGKQYFTVPQIKILCERYGVSADIFIP